MTDSRRQKYKENRINGMTPYNAARAAGYSKIYSYQAKQRLDIPAKEDIKDAFEQAGLTDKQIIKHALEGLNATTVGMDGKSTNSPNWNVRHKYLMTILELTDRIKNQISIDNSKHLHNVFLSEKLKEARMRVNAEPSIEQP